MLKLTRTKGTAIYIGQDIIIRVLKITERHVTLGITATPDVKISRVKMAVGKPTTFLGKKDNLIVEQGIIQASQHEAADLC